MQEAGQKLRLWLIRNEIRILWGAMFVFFAAVSLACVWKYAMFGYNGIDLAYFNQVFWNTVHGRPFVESINPRFSLGDHAEFAILPLSLLYALFQDPRTLLVMQAAALALTAWPVWHIARRRFARHAVSVDEFRLAPLVIALAWLLNPSLQNIGLFEFHILPFALFPLFMAVIAYEDGKKKNFLLWTVAALLVREDVAIVVVMFGVLAWLERKAIWWRIAPVVLGGAWFVAAMRVIAHFAPVGSYKYRIYYAWLGSNPAEIFVNVVNHPLLFLEHIVTLPNLEMVIGFLMPFLLLPLLAPMRLLLAVGPLLQIILGAPGGGELIIDTHYATLFLPALLLATVEGLAAAPAFCARHAKPIGTTELRRFVCVLLLASATYSAAVLGPLVSVAKRAITDDALRQRAALQAELVKRIPKDASVAASYALLPALSSREQLASLHYVALGVTQFAEEPYAPPANLRFVALDADDLLTYRTQFLETSWAQPYYSGSTARIARVTGPVAFSTDTLALYDRKAKTNLETSAITAGPTSATSALTTNDGIRHVHFTVHLRADEVADGADARYLLHDRTGAILYDASVPVDALPPWTARVGDDYVLAFDATVPAHFSGTLSPEVRIEIPTSTYILDGIRTSVRDETSDQVLRNFLLPPIVVK
jgi:uncharacterized membrane protein